MHGKQRPTPTGRESLCETKSQGIDSSSFNLESSRPALARVDQDVGPRCGVHEAARYHRGRTRRFTVLLISVLGRAALPALT